MEVLNPHLCWTCHVPATKIGHDKHLKRNLHFCEDCYTYLRAKGILKVFFNGSLFEFLKVPRTYLDIIKETGYSLPSVRRRINVLLDEGKIERMKVSKSLYFFIIPHNHQVNTK